MGINSKYFNLNEFLISQEAIRFGIQNIPDKRAIENIQWLCTKILDPLREKIGKPIVISSGYRSPELNKKIGGAQFPPSQHTMGKAADIIVPGISAKQLMDFIITQTTLPFDQLILEYLSWCHISYDRDKVQQRGEKLLINQGTGYVPYKG